MDKDILRALGWDERLVEEVMRAADAVADGMPDLPGVIVEDPADYMVAATGELDLSASARYSTSDRIYLPR